MADKLSQLLKIYLSLSSQPMRTIVAGLFGKLYKLFSKQFQEKKLKKKNTEVTLRKATKDKKYAILDKFINKCWEFYNTKDINQSKKKHDFQLAFLDEISQRKSSNLISNFRRIEIYKKYGRFRTFWCTPIINIF